MRELPIDGRVEGGQPVRGTRLEAYIVTDNLFGIPIQHEGDEDQPLGLTSTLVMSMPHHRFGLIGTGLLRVGVRVAFSC